VKVRDIIKRLEAEGWYHVETRGSHRQYKHPVKRGRVTVSGHLSDDVRRGTLGHIVRQAGWKGIDQ
jgi:predicted RNA binding protein YcfA (HicA-like mRNA interferase family)